MTTSPSRIRDGNLIAAVQQVQAALTTAMESGDWEKVVALDDELRINILAAIEGLENAEAKLALQHQLQELQDVYQRLIEQGAEFRDGLAQQLKQVRKKSSAVNQYLKSGLGRG